MDSIGVDAKVLTELKSPFMPEDIEWRVARSGLKDGKPWAQVLAYVTNRAIMDRLDDTLGAENWRNEYTKGPDGGVLCGLSILVKERAWVTKWDGAGNTDIEAVKGGLSDSMKRSAVQWGIGRYLYHLEATWAEITPNGVKRDKAKQKDGPDVWFRWNPPKLPSWALPGGAREKATVPDSAPDADSAPSENKEIGNEIWKSLKRLEAIQKIGPDQFGKHWNRTLMNIDKIAVLTEIMDTLKEIEAEASGGDSGD